MVDLITATETAIRSNKLTQAEAKQIRPKASAGLVYQCSLLTKEETRVILALSQEPNITILPADKGRCVIILDTSDYRAKMTTLHSDNST